MAGDKERVKSTKCELCDVLLCAYVTGVQQMLVTAMHIERTWRFDGDFDAAVQSHEEGSQQTQQAWANFWEHLATHGELE